MLGEAALPLAVGGSLLVVGQLLNLAVFYRLGVIGVFYGSQFGEEIPWCQEFPFSLCRHPQYIGTLCSIWGFSSLSVFRMMTGMCFLHSKRCIMPTVRTWSHNRR